MSRYGANNTKVYWITWPVLLAFTLVMVWLDGASMLKSLTNVRARRAAGYATALLGCRSSHRTSTDLRESQGRLASNRPRL